MTSTTTREERLSWSPDKALELVRASGGSESATAALAMFEQLDAAGVPLEALEMCIVLWSRALDGLAPGPVPAARLARLDADMAIEMQTEPVLAGWLAALRRDLREAGDLDRAIQLLMLARTTWTTTQWMTARGQPTPPVEFPLGAQVAGGLYTITEWLRGQPERGMGRAAIRDRAGRCLVTMGTRQRRPAGERMRELALVVDGVARLRHIGPVSGPDGEFDAMVEDEPAGRPTSELALPLDPAAAVRLALEVAAVLQRAHAAGHVLRHVRPELVYADARDGLRLTGVAPRADGFLIGVTAPCYGVPALFPSIFAAPEVMAMREAPTPAADVFSLCALLAVWLTGEHPFAGDTLMDQMGAMMRNHGRPWRGPMKLGMALGPGLDPDPASRPPLARLMRSLEAAALLS
jgi:hypothetical protein